MDKKIELTTGFSCNQNCRFCSVRQITLEKKHEQLIKEVDKICIEKNREEISFTGGEPTIRKDICELITYVKNKGIKKIRIVTNGRMFSYENFTNKIVNSGLNFATFSINSLNKNLNDYLAQTKGSFDQCMQGFKNLREFLDDIDINILINTENYKEMPKMVEFFIDKYEIKTIRLIFPVIEGNILKNLWLVPTYDQIKKYLQNSIDIVKNKGKKIYVLNVPLCFLEGYENCVVLEREYQDGIVEKEENKVKLEVCEGCKYDKICSGISRDYLNLKGKKGINSVKGKLIKSAEEIYKI